MKYHRNKKEDPSNDTIEKLVLLMTYHKANPSPTDLLQWNHMKVSRVVGLRIGVVKGIVNRFKSHYDPAIDKLLYKEATSGG
jgi:hypothetical protein